MRCRLEELQNNLRLVPLKLLPITWSQNLKNRESRLRFLEDRALQGGGICSICNGIHNNRSFNIVKLKKKEAQITKAQGDVVGEKKKIRNHNHFSFHRCIFFIFVTWIFKPISRFFFFYLNLAHEFFFVTCSKMELSKINKTDTC